MDSFRAAAAIILDHDPGGGDPSQAWADAVRAHFPPDGDIDCAPDAFGPKAGSNPLRLHASHELRSDGPGLGMAVEKALRRIERLGADGAEVGESGSAPVLTGYLIEEDDHVRLDTDSDGALQPLAAACALLILAEELREAGALPAQLSPRD